MAKASRYERLRAARIAVVQAIFMHQMGHKKIQLARNQFLNHFFDEMEICPTPAERPIFIAILNTFETREKDIAQFLESCLQGDWTLERMDPTLKAILSAGAAELLTDPLPSPAPVIVSEYVDVAKSFFDKDEKSFVNKALDHYAQSLGHAMSKPKKSSD